jgi:PEP-CTERM motif
VQFAGDVEFSVTARLVTEIGGLAAGSEHDRLTIQGQVSLNGLLDVQLLSAFQPSAGDVFTIIDNLSSNSINGTFTGLQEGAYFVSGGQLWNITYQGGTGNDVMLMAVPEPSTWALLGVTGLGGAAVYWRKRRQVEVDIATL